MRFLVLLALVGLFFTACNDKRVYQVYSDFDERHWLVGQKPSFDFTIDNTTDKYNVYCNIRNSTVYPFSRLFITYYLQDSTKKEIQKQLVGEYLFDPKTGEPYGTSGLGDLYDHQILLLKDYTFGYPGKYTIMFEQFMRTDTLEGVLAVGLRIEKSMPKE